MKIELHCFGCKVHVFPEVDAEDVRQVAKNQRHLVDTSCPECGRSITSLISKSIYQQVIESDGRLKESNLRTVTSSGNQQ